MKTDKLKLLIRNIAREEVAMAIQEVVTELKQPTQTVDKKLPKKKQIKQKNYSKNSILNEVLNDTANQNEWKLLGGESFTADKMDSVLNHAHTNQASTTKEQTVASFGVDPSQVPEHVTNALTRNYRDVMKAVDKKKAQ